MSNDKMARLMMEMRDVLENNILCFWMNRMVDEENGGFLGRIDGVSSEYKINIAHDDEKNRDIIMLTVEAEGRVSFDDTALKIKNLLKQVVGVTPKVVVVPVGTLPRSEKKTKRVFDHREE